MLALGSSWALMLGGAGAAPCPELLLGYLGSVLGAAHLPMWGPQIPACGCLYPRPHRAPGAGVQVGAPHPMRHLDICGRLSSGLNKQTPPAWPAMATARGLCPGSGGFISEAICSGSRIPKPLKQSLEQGRRRALHPPVRVHARR